MASRPSFIAKIVMRRPQDLILLPDNPNVGNRKQRKAIKASVQKFGFVVVVLIDGQGRVIAGHARVLVAPEMGLSEIPIICLNHLSPAELLAFRITDNRTGQLGTWDMQILAENYIEIQDLDPLLDLTVTGYEMDEIELILDAGKARLQHAVPETPPPPLPVRPVCQLGDIWRIGDIHRLICADARDPTSYKLLMEGRKADLVITDPPFNCKIGGHVSGLGKNKHAEFMMASGEMTRSEFQSFLRETIGQLISFSRSGSVHYIFMDWRNVSDLIVEGEAFYDRLLNIAVWVKSNGGMEAFYRSRHEMIVIFRKGKRQHINNIELGKNGRNRTNVWEYPGASSFGKGRDAQLALHPTAKPIAAISDAIMDASDRADLILDPFGGSGTTLLACQDTGRHARIMELDPRYVDVMITRAALAGLTAHLAVSGETFSDVEARRLASCEEDL